MLLIKILYDGAFLKEQRVASRQAVIGHSDNCEIVLRDSSVSSFHALLDFQDDAWLIVDTSEEGTFLNGEQIATSRLERGDTLAIGNFSLEIIELTAFETTPIQAAWSLPFSEQMSEEDVEQLLRHPPFRDLDFSVFPSGRRLRHILLNDTRTVTYKNGDIILREGDFGTTAFFVLEGSVSYLLESLPGQLLGRKQRRRKGWIDILRQIWGRSSVPEFRSVKSLGLDSRLGQRSSERAATQIFIQNVESVLTSYASTVLKSGEIFGEISALGRTPRPATVVAKGETKVLEMRWQGLRDLRLYSEQIREMLDDLYRSRSLEKHIRESELFSDLSEANFEELKRETVFQTFGEFDWQNAYEVASDNLDEPVIVKEGEYINGIILIRSGFAKVTERVSAGAKTVRYLSRGDYFGLSEIAHNWKTGEQLPYQETLQAIGYADTLMVPTEFIENHVLPGLEPERLPKPIEDRRAKRKKETPEVDPGLLDFLVSNRFHNGKSIMMIDLNRCTRCNDCVTACASAHDDNPRFIRDGKQYAQYLVAHSCMHCSDPVCMIGCPTGAIHRDINGGEIVINEMTCIGCSVCADSCPYGNIQMVSLRKSDSEFLKDEQTQRPVMKATKCDLCVDQIGGPACENSCPTEALKRVDLSDFESLVEWGKKG